MGPQHLGEFPGVVPGGGVAFSMEWAAARSRRDIHRGERGSGPFAALLPGLCAPRGGGGARRERFHAGPREWGPASRRLVGGRRPGRERERPGGGALGRRTGPELVVARRLGLDPAHGGLTAPRHGGDIGRDGPLSPSISCRLSCGPLLASGRGFGQRGGALVTGVGGRRPGWALRSCGLFMAPRFGGSGVVDGRSLLCGARGGPSHRHASGTARASLGRRSGREHVAGRRRGRHGRGRAPPRRRVVGSVAVAARSLIPCPCSYFMLWLAGDVQGGGPAARWPRRPGTRRAAASGRPAVTP